MPLHPGPSHAWGLMPSVHGRSLCSSHPCELRQSWCTNNIVATHRHRPAVVSSPLPANGAQTAASPPSWAGSPLGLPWLGLYSRSLRYPRPSPVRDPRFRQPDAGATVRRGCGPAAEQGWQLIKSSAHAVINESQHGRRGNARGLFAGVGSEAPNVCLPAPSANRRLGGLAQLPEQLQGGVPAVSPRLTFAGGREKGDTGGRGR